MNRHYGKKTQGSAKGSLLNRSAMGGNVSSDAPASSFGPDSELPGQDVQEPTSAAPGRPGLAQRMKSAVAKPMAKRFGKGK